MNNDVPSRRYLLPVATYDFSHSPPDAVAHYCATECLLDAESETVQGKFVASNENSEVGTREALPGAVHSIEFAASHQSRFTRKPLVRRGRAATIRV
jgi:hypothetical protein